VNVVVTGGAGYIGSVVAEQLVEDGHDVLVCDSLVKGHREAVVPGARFLQVDIGDREAMTRAFRDQRTGAVIHMAAHSLVGESVASPGKYYANNVAAGIELLEAMRAAEVPRIVFSSSAAVYGEPARQPIEEHDPTQPTNTYGETKLAFERALAWYERAHGLRYASLRYFNAAGATARCGEHHDPETHLIPIVLDVARGRRAEVTVFGDDYPTPDGTCIRDYVHVVDLARAHILALGILGARSAIYNLGCGGSGYSVRQVIDVARAVTGLEIATRIGPRRGGDPAVLVASSERIRADLGWAPRFGDLAAIVSSAWEFVRSHPDGYRA
jgi:UDP-glucose 4-epimerase